MSEYLTMKLGEYLEKVKGKDIEMLAHYRKFIPFLSKISDHITKTGITITDFNEIEAGEKLNYLNELLEQAEVPSGLRKELITELFGMLTPEETHREDYSTAEIPEGFEEKLRLL